jgi:4-amino-4-deoxy-L-arabinose transferase-like glycosyltransferase
MGMRKGMRFRDQRLKKFTPVLLVAVLVLTWILRMNFWGQPFEMDEGLHAYMGWGMLQGLVPFKDMYNTKPPGIYALHALLFLFAEPTALNIKVFASIYTLLTTIAVFFTARKLAGDTAGLLAALLFGIFSSGPNIQGGGVNSEVFMVLPYTLAAYSLLRALETEEPKHYLLFGIFTGLACTLKQVAAVNLLWIALYLVFRIVRARDWNTRARAVVDGLWVAAGAALPWLPFVGYFFVNDALSKFYFWMVSANFQYIGDGYQELPGFTLFTHRMKLVLSESGPLWLLALIGLWRGGKEFRRHEVASPNRELGRDYRILISTWPIFSFLGVALGGRFFSHYYIQMVPSLAVLGGVGLMSLIHEVRIRGTSLLKRPIALAVTAVLGWTLVLFVKTDSPYYLNYDSVQISLRQYGNPIFSVTRFIGSYLKDHTKPEDLIYVWPVNPEINFYALRRSPSPFLIQVDFDHIPWDPYKEIVESLRRKPPKYIVALTGMSGLPGLRDYVHSNYRVESNAELDKLKQFVPFEIYRRKGV